MIIAHSVSLGLCSDPTCTSIHIYFHHDDEDERPVAMAALPFNALALFIDNLQRLGYAVAAERMEDKT